MINKITPSADQKLMVEKLEHYLLRPKCKTKYIKFLSQRIRQGYYKTLVQVKKGIFYLYNMPLIAKWIGIIKYTELNVSSKIFTDFKSWESYLLFLFGLKHEILNYACQ